MKGHSRVSSDTVTQRRSGAVLVFVASALLALSPFVYAQSGATFGGTWNFELIAGAGTPVCEAYATRRVRPDGSGIGYGGNDYHGDLRIADLGETHGGYVSTSELLSNVANFLWQRDANPAWYITVDQAESWTGSPEQIAEAHESFMQRFQEDIDGFGYSLPALDIDNDGDPEPLFFSSRGVGSTLLVLDARGADVDRTATERLLKHPSRRKAGWADTRPPWPREPKRYSREAVMDAYIGARYDVLLEGDHVLVGFQWSVHPEYSIGDWTTRRTQHLYLTVGDRIEQHCEVRQVY
jgi:hypothetical protein